MSLSLLLSRYFFKNRFLLTYSILFCVSICVYFHQDRRSSPEKEESVKSGSRTIEASCHSSIATVDALPLLPRNASFPLKSIFFHDTSCTNGLTPRQACAVESAARLHPEHQINVLFTSAVTKKNLQQSSMKILLAKYMNVKIARVHIKDYAKETPLAAAVNLLSDDRLNVYISKLMKYLTMYKYSGIYLGLDVIVARPFDELWANWAIRETNMILSSDMFSFSENKVGRKLAEMALGYLISEIFLNKQSDHWSVGRPGVMTRMLQLWCTTSEVQHMSLTNCDNLAVYGPELFYPISFHDRATYFKTTNWDKWKDQKIYTYHVWEYFTKYNIVTKFSLYGRIVHEYCPTIYAKYNEKLSSYLLL